jgi:hypothetical protein
MPELAAGSLAGKLSSNVLSWVRSECVLLGMAIPFPPAPVPVSTSNARANRRLRLLRPRDLIGLIQAAALLLRALCVEAGVASWHPCWALRREAGDP